MTAMEQSETTSRSRGPDQPLATERAAELGALPARWFPADKDKLIYLAIRAKVMPTVLEQLGQLRHGARFEDLSALMRAARRTPRRVGTPRPSEVRPVDDRPPA